MKLGRITLAVPLAMLALGMPTDARAGFIAGSMALGTSSITLVNGTNLANTTMFTLNSFGGGANSVQSGASSGNYGSGAGNANIPVGAVFTATTLNLNNLASFSFTSSTYGTFQAVASLGGGLNSQVLQQTTGFLDVILYGNYSGLPGGNPTAFVATPTSVEFSFNQAGTLVGGGGSLNTPPVLVVPEPSSLGLCGLAGLIGLGYARARRERPVD